MDYKVLMLDFAIDDLINFFERDCTQSGTHKSIHLPCEYWGQKQDGAKVLVQYPWRGIYVNPVEHAILKNKKMECSCSYDELFKVMAKLVNTAEPDFLMVEAQVGKFVVYPAYKRTQSEIDAMIERNPKHWEALQFHKQNHTFFLGDPGAPKRQYDPHFAMDLMTGEKILASQPSPHL